MCFSTTGSFALGVVLVTAGSYTIKEAAKKDKSYIPFACIPLLFGIQQIAEGFVWVGMLHGYHLLVITGSLFFTFFAIGFWPFFAPFSVYFMKREKKPILDHFLLALVCLGAFVGIYSFIPILSGALPMTTKILNHSISYNTKVLNVFKYMNEALYLFIVIAPFLVVPNKRLRSFGLLLLASTVIASYFFFACFVSVWCLFAAVMSLDIAYILKGLPERR